VIAAKAVCFHEARQPAFAVHAQQVVANAKALGEALAGHGFRLVSGGTDNHLILLDVRSHGVTGRQAELALERAGITANKNTIPFDPQKPMIASGIRLGTAALTTRGMKEAEMRRIAAMIDRALKAPEDERALAVLEEEVAELASAFPLYVAAA